MPFDSQWLTAFLLTELIETPIYCAALRGYRSPTRFLGAFGASLITHPVVWWAIVTFGQENYWLLVAISEVGAVVTETAYLRLFGVSRALAWSLLANGTSYGFGFVWQFFLGLF